MPSPILAIDSSTSRAYAAVRLASGGIIEGMSRGEISHNEELSKVIAELLEQARIRPAELRGILVGSGPGSFTGLRIGYSVAKGMAFALKIPVAEISSHLAIALGAEVPSGSVVTLGDARREEFFCSAFRIAKNGSEWEELLKPHLLPASSLPRLLTQFPSAEPLRIFTETTLPAGIETPAEALKALGRGLLLGLKDAEFQPVSPESLAEMEPAYLRAVAAKTISERDAEKARKAG